VTAASRTLVLADRYSTGELWSHSLVLPTLYIGTVLVATRRGRRRRAYMALGVGWLFHLLLDGMWLDQSVFLWPFFGLEIPPGDVPFWPLAWDRAIHDPWRWVKEVIGLGYLAWLWQGLGLGASRARRAILETGRLPDDADET